MFLDIETRIAVARAARWLALGLTWYWFGWKTALVLALLQIWLILPWKLPR